MHLMQGSEHIPRVHGVYMHNNFWIFVMDLAGVEIPAKTLEAVPVESFATNPPEPGNFFNSFPGKRFIDKGRPFVTEIQVCKIVSGLLSAINHMLDLHFVHTDISHRNYMVDWDLKVSLFSYGLISL